MAPPLQPADIAMTRDEAERLLVANMAAVDRAIGVIARRRGWRGDDADDFAGSTKLWLVDDDYAIVRKFRGEASFATYLAVVIAMQAREYVVRERGKWRHSAAARREGPLAMQLESLVHRDGLSLREAAEHLRASGATALTDKGLSAMLTALPDRSALRPVMLDDDAVQAASGPDRADGALDRCEEDDERTRVRTLLSGVLDGLADDERCALRLRFWHDMTIADIARALGCAQKPLYRRIERTLGRLARELEALGVSPAAAMRLLGETDE